MTSRRLIASLVLLASVLGVTAFAQPPAKPAVTAEEEQARELFAAQKYEETYKALQAAVGKNPKLPPARVLLASMFYQAKQGQLARQTLEAAASEDPKHPEVYLMNANFAFGEGRLTDAILSCQALLQVASDPRWDPEQRKRFIREARLGLAASYEGRRDFTNAKEHLMAVLTDDPKNGPARTRLGSATFLMNKPDEALVEFQTAYRDDPASELPELQMAALYNSQNADEKAEEWFKKAVTTYATNPKSHRAYAAWLIDHSRATETELYLKTAAQLDPASKETAALQGLAARYRKDFAAAEPIFQKLLQDSPNNAFAAWNLALTLAESPMKDKQVRAVELAESEVRKNQKNAEAYAVLGWCYYKAGQLDNAEKALANAMQSGSLSRDAAYFFARILVDKQRSEDAYKILKSVADARGPYVYKAEGTTLLAEVEKKLPPKKDEKK